MLVLHLGSFFRALFLKRQPSFKVSTYPAHLASNGRRNRVELENEREERIAGHKHHSDTLWDMRSEIATFKIQAAKDKDQQDKINAANEAMIKELKKYQQNRIQKHRDQQNKEIRDLKKEIRELKQVIQRQGLITETADSECEETKSERKQPARRSVRIVNLKERSKLNVL